MRRPVSHPVPNVPCGVESPSSVPRFLRDHQNVPNVPCGVESPELKLAVLLRHGFLMYRVELKEQFA